MPSTARVLLPLLVTLAFALGGCDDKPSNPPSPTPDRPLASSPSTSQPAGTTAKPEASAEQAKADPSSEAKPAGSGAADGGDKAATAKKGNGEQATTDGGVAAGNKDAATDDKKDAEEPPGKVVGEKKAESSYAAWLQSAGKYTVGKSSTVQAVLIAKGEFKCNENYPFKFKLNAPPSGVSYPSKIARNISIGKKRSVLSIPFTASEAGQKTISGTFYFSVCNPQSCHIKKQPMSVAVTVN